MADPPYQFSELSRRKPVVPHLQQERPYGPSSNQSIFAHSRVRTASSSIFPEGQPNPYPNNMYQASFHSKRTPSTGTFSTIASNGNGSAPNRQSQNSTDLLRSGSAHSGKAPTFSYVALMRKQKATVWCDRAQYEDPNLVAVRRQEKIRAVSEMMGGSAGRISTGGSSSIGGNRVTAKIRHHGRPGLTDFKPAENFGVGIGGVPMRLIASEVEGGDSDDDAGSGGMSHRRTGSGRSSSGSGRRGLAYRRSGASANSSGRWSSGHTPPSERDLVDPLTGGTPAPTRHPRSKDFFPTNENSDGRKSISSGGSSSGERADGVADLGLTTSNAARLASNSLLRSTITREKSTKNPDELRRRGSVDERAMSLSTGRLFVANPDVGSD